MASHSSVDRMSAVPLMNLTERRAHNSTNPNNDDWSDQEFEEFSRDPLESVLMQMRLWPQSITRQQCLRSAVYTGAVTLCLGFVSAYLLFMLLYPPDRCHVQNKFDHHLLETLHKEINSTYIRKYLKTFTDHVIEAGTNEDKKAADYIAKLWQDQGLTDVHLVPYKVLLNHPDKKKPNKIEILDDPVINLNSFNFGINSSTVAFVAFSKSDSVGGKLVYVNYGRKEDYSVLESNHISSNFTIGLCRLGKLNIHQLVSIAEANNVAALIVYADPKDYALEGQDKVYPKTLWLPGVGVKSFSLGQHGDALTPHFPAIDSSYRQILPQMEKSKIPVQTISYKDAELLLKYIKGKNSTRSDWKGALNSPYVIGKSNSLVSVSVNNKDDEAEIFNVVGIIEGRTEPDRYVVIGNHRDAFGLGSVDSHGGTAVLLELTRVFGILLKNGWRPRRTLVFCSWTAGAYGHIGSTEWAQEHAKVLKERAVAYLNLDVVVQGLLTLQSIAVPSLHELIRDVAKMVPNPNPKEIAEGRKTVYDTWVKNSAPLKLPRIFNPTMFGDSCNYIHVLGIPVAELRFTNNSILDHQWTFPMHNTYNESYELVEHLLDKNFTYHVAVTQIYGSLAMQLADLPILPLNMEDYAVELKRIFNIIMNSSSIEEDKEFTSNLQKSIDAFFNSTKEFDEILKKTQLIDSMKLRQINDQLMQIERTFIADRGLYCLPEFKHVIFSRDIQKVQDEDSFSCLDSFSPKTQITLEEIASLTFHVQSAADILKSHPLNSFRI